MIRAWAGEATGSRPGPACWIIEFRVPTRKIAVVAADDEDLAVGQQRRRGTNVSVREAASGPPSPGDWIVEFGARTGEVAATCDEHRPVGQQRGRVTKASRVQTAGVLKSKGCARARLQEHQPCT